MLLGSVRYPDGDKKIAYELLTIYVHNNILFTQCNDDIHIHIRNTFVSFVYTI